MRTITIIVGVLLFVSSFAVIGYEWQWRPDFQARPPKPGTTIGFEGSTSLPAQEAQNALDQANSEVDSRFTTAARLGF